VTPCVEKLCAEKLTARYGDRFIFNEISLEIDFGAVTLVTGANGSGKSTLLQILAGLRRPLSGTVTFNGEVVCPSTPKIAASYRNRVGYLGHELLLYRELTVRENLRLFSAGHSSTDASVSGVGAILLDSFNLRPHLDKTLSACSFGIAKKTSIVRALLHNPDAIIFDEPFSGLDKDSSDALAAVLSARKSAGAAIVLSSHEDQVAAGMVTAEFQLGD
jgi:ABC-type multidrug transport system ATPase subunit